MLKERHGFTSDQRYAVAFSGGADSMALLIALQSALKKSTLNEDQSEESSNRSKKITALHFNHRINSNSDQWQRFCEQVCHSLDVPILLNTWTTPRADELNEAEARQARYNWFSEVVEPDQVLLTAHHADDQAETVLMHLLQGRDLSRLAGIPARRSLGFNDARTVCRPLLDFPRESLVDYLDRARLGWIEDPANRDQRYTRNYIRAQLMPLIKRRWPSALGSICVSAANLAESNKLLDLQLSRSLERIKQDSARRLFCLAPPLRVDKLIGRSKFEFCQLLRYWVHSAGLISPSQAQLVSLYSQLTRDQNQIGDRSPVTHVAQGKISWKTMSVVSYGSHLFLIRNILNTASEIIPCRLEHTNFAPGFSVYFEEVHEGGISRPLAATGELNWCWRRGGEKIKLLKRQHRSSLKKILQQQRVPEWERRLLPYLESKGEIVWVHGIGVTRDFTVSEKSTEQVLPRFHYDPSVQ